MREGWETRTLAEACVIKPPKNEARKTLSDSDLVSFVPMNDLGIREKRFNLNGEKPLAEVAGSYTYFADGDVLLAKITPCFENGKLGIADGLRNGIGFGSSEFIVFRPKEDLDREYLFYFLAQDSFRDAGARVMSGAVGHKRVPKEFIEEHLIPLPPLPEQKRIVAILDEAFAGIDSAIANTEKNLANARELFESHLNSVFSQRGSGWVQRRLGDVVERLTNGYVGPTRGIYLEKGVPYLLARHVKNNRLRFDEKTFISQEFNQKNKKSMLKFEDVLLVQSGHIGHSAVVTEEHEGHNCHAMIVITPIHQIIVGPFLSLCFNTPIMRQRFQAIRSGSTVPHLTCREVKELLIDTPDVCRQREIVAYFEEIESEVIRLESIYQQKLTALAELKQSLLQKAFSGELTSEKAYTELEAADA